MTSVQENFNGFFAAQAKLESFTPTTMNGRSIYRFNPTSGKNIPLHIRTGALSLQSMPSPLDPVARKKFQGIEFHGRGSLYVRVYVDGVWIMDGTVTLAETPSKDRGLGLPIGTRGYTIDIEFCGDADIRAIEYTYKEMPKGS